MGNRGNIFEHVVSVEAWRGQFSTEDPTASVHVDISFKTAKIGDEADSSVRFELSLKRAEVAFVIPNNEPLAVIQKSVSRETPLTGTIEKSNTSQKEAILGFETSLSSQLISPKLEAKFSTSKDNSAKISLRGNISEFETRQYLSNDNYCWEIKSINGEKLNGKIWDPVQEPRLSVKNLEKNNKIDPSCRIAVSCKKEDIIIDKLESKIIVIFT